jgi:hypothetical protein
MSRAVIVMSILVMHVSLNASLQELQSSIEIRSKNKQYQPFFEKYQRGRTNIS